MKKALSLLLVVLMLVGMLPMTVLNASAAEVSETITLAGSTGTVSGESISWTSGNLAFTANKNTSSTAIRTSDTDHFRLYVGFSATLTCSAGNITKIVMTATGSSYAVAPTGEDGSVGTVSGTTITIVPSESSNTYTIPSISKQTRIKSITVTYDDPNAVGCAHANTETIEAKDATCTTAGNTAGEKCTDCGATVSGNETIEALGHKNDAGVVTAPTCTEDGYTTYTCTVCGSAKKDDYVDATGHNYVDGVCSVCKIEMPTGLDGKYYIAAIRSSGNYQYMTNDLGTASTKRYQIVDSGLTVLPENITAPVDAQVFELVSATDAGTYKIKTGDQYLGWTSDNSGALVDEASAIAATIEHSETEGAYVIHFTDSTGTEPVERYLSLNNNASNAYYAWYKSGQISDLYLVPVATVTPCPDENHNFVDGVCTKCGETEPIGPIDPSDPTEPTEPEVTEPETPAVSTTTIDFSTTDQRVSLDTSSQVWKNGDATVTNNKAGSSSDVVDYSNPARFYKNSELIIALTGMTKIEIVCSSASYATTLAGCISDSTVTVTTDDKTVTIVPAALIDSYTITLTGGQVRVSSITMTASTCEHIWGEWVETTKPNCTTAGVNTTTCSVCNNSKTESVPATGHSYDVDGNCTVCGITPAQVVDMAYALEDGKALEGKYTLTGVISAVNEIYSDQYKNITVTMNVVGVTGKPIMCYQMKGEGVDQIGTGDTITVTGTLKNYGGTIEFDSGCTLDSWEDTGAEFVRPETPEEIVNAAYALEVGTTLEGGTYTLTGVITSVGTAYNSKYSNVTVTIQIGDMTDKPIVCYRLAGTGADQICVGDSVTVTGNLKNYNGTVEFDSGCTLDSYVINNGHTEVIDAAVEATCTEAGKTEGKHCSVCNLVIVAQEDVSALGHDYSGENGACVNCGAADPNAPTGPIIDENLKFADIGIAFAEFIGVQTIVMKKTVADYTSYYIEAVHVLPDGTREVQVLNPVQDNKTYSGYDLPMVPYQMCDDIIMTIYAEKDGVAYQSVPVVTSIKKLAMDKIEAYYKANETAACRILVDMLVYGSETQKIFGDANSPDPAADLNEYAALGTSETPEISGAVTSTGSGIRLYGNSLSLGSQVEIQFMFKAADIKGCEFRYTIEGQDTVIIPAEDFTPYGNYAYTLFALKPANFRSDITVGVYNSTTGEAVSAVYTVSAEAYSAQFLANNQYTELLPAMINYGDAVYAMFGA